MTESLSRESNEADRGGRRPPFPRRFRLAIVVGLGLVLAAAAGADLWLRSQSHQGSGPTSPAQIGGAFSLIDPKGKLVTDQDFRGRYLLVYFGYTRCPDVCPTTLAKIVAALRTLGPSGRQVQPIFITVDPAHDTPDVMGRYAALFSPRILGLTGSAAQITAVEKAYRVYSSVGATPAQLDAAIDHSTVLYLMGPDGRFVGPVQTAVPPKGMAADLSRYLNQ